MCSNCLRGEAGEVKNRYTVAVGGIVAGLNESLIWESGGRGITGSITWKNETRNTRQASVCLFLLFINLF